MSEQQKPEDAVSTYLDTINRHLDRVIPAKEADLNNLYVEPESLPRIGKYIEVVVNPAVPPDTAYLMSEVDAKKGFPDGFDIRKFAVEGDGE